MGGLEKATNSLIVGIDYDSIYQQLFMSYLDAVSFLNLLLRHETDGTLSPLAYNIRYTDCSSKMHWRVLI